jgi:hypothetical protein
MVPVNFTNDNSVYNFIKAIDNEEPIAISQPQINQGFATSKQKAFLRRLRLKLKQPHVDVQYLTKQQCAKEIRKALKQIKEVANDNT